MIEINLNFVLFEELQENPENHGLVTRIVVIRQNKNSAAAIDNNVADEPLE